MSRKTTLTRSEKVAVRIAIKAALYLRGSRCYFPSHYQGVLDGISLVAMNLGYARRQVRFDRRFARIEKLITHARKS